MQFKDKSRLRSTVALPLGILGSLVMSSATTLAQGTGGPSTPNNGQAPTSRQASICKKRKIDLKAGVQDIDIIVEPCEEVEVTTDMVAGDPPHINGGKIVNDGILKFKGNKHVTFGPLVTVRNLGHLKLETKGQRKKEMRVLNIVNDGGEIEIDGSYLDANIENNSGSVIVRPGSFIHGNIQATKGMIHLIGSLRERTTVQGDVTIGHNAQLVFPSGAPAPPGFFSTASSRREGANLTLFAEPSPLLFNITGNLNLGSGQAAVTIDYDSSVNPAVLKFGQLDVGGTVTLDGAALAVNVTSAAAPYVDWTHHFDIIKSPSIVNSSGGAGEFGSWSASGLSGTGRRLGHRQNYIAGSTTDRYWIDVLTYQSSAAAGTNIPVHGDFAVLPTASQFKFTNNKTPTSNPTRYQSSPTEIRVNVPTNVTTGPLRWSTSSSTVVGETVTFNNFTPQ